MSVVEVLEELDSATLFRLECGSVSKSLIKLLRNLLMRPSSDAASPELWRALSILYARISCRMPSSLYVDQASDLRLHRSCWFFCNVLTAKYTLIDWGRPSSGFNDHSLTVFYEALTVLSSLVSTSFRYHFCWTSETYWLLFYLHEVTLIPFFADRFCSYRGHRDVSNILSRSLRSVAYEIDLYNDDMILVMILKNLVEAVPEKAFHRRIVPTFLTYLEINRKYVFDCLGTLDCQKNVLLIMVSVIVSLLVNADEALHQYLDRNGQRTLLDFIGSHPEVDVTLYRYLTLIQRWHQIKISEQRLTRFMKSSMCYDLTNLLL